MNVLGTDTEKPECTPNDGNAFSIMAAAHRALRRAGVPSSVRDEMSSRARDAADYTALLTVVSDYVDLSV